MAKWRGPVRARPIDHVKVRIRDLARRAAMSVGEIPRACAAMSAQNCAIFDQDCGIPARFISSAR
jgi:hypothetical protein